MFPISVSRILRNGARQSSARSAFPIPCHPTADPLNSPGVAGFLSLLFKPGSEESEKMDTPCRLTPGDRSIGWSCNSMNRHLGATYSLSVFLVVMCVVAFYRAENPRDPTRRSARADRVDIGPRRHREIEGRDASRVAETSAYVAPPTSVRPSPTSGSLAPTGPSAGGSASPVAHRISRQGTGTGGAFTRVDDGETLADVARRVYGPSGKVDVLWKANRDQLLTPEAPLSGGMLLRTP